MGRWLLEAIRCFKCSHYLPTHLLPSETLVLLFGSSPLFLCFFLVSLFSSFSLNFVQPSNVQSFFPSYFSSVSLCITSFSLPKECLWGHVKHHPALELILPGGWWRWFISQCHHFRLSANSETLPCHKYLLPTAGHGPTCYGWRSQMKACSLQSLPTPSLYHLFWVQFMGQTSS